MELIELVKKIEDYAHEQNYGIGKLQELRQELKGLARRPGSKIFDERYVTPDWAFHYGGRKELQFNIGFEEDQCRYGIAFSLEPSRSLPDVSVLYPQIDLFNEWFRQNHDTVADLEMWHWENEKRSTNYAPAPIPDALKHPGVFIFMGMLVDMSSVESNLAPILELFDRLLPLYRYVETDSIENRFDPMPNGINFKEGCPDKLSSTQANISGGQRTIHLRHNVLQKKLYAELCGKYSEIGVEAKTPTGSIDLWGKNPDGSRDYYEIKTAISAQACIREAIPQLLEYSYWPGSHIAANLIIAAEAEFDKAAQKYLETLRTTFKLPISYYQIKKVV